MKTSACLASVLRVAGAVSCLAARVTRAEEPAAPNVDPRLGTRFASVVADAAERLDRAPCALVLLDFVDTRTGLTLADTLAASGRSASEHVRSLRFARSPRPARVDPVRTYAYMRPAGREVFINWYDFSRILGQRSVAVAVVIHETLHTLGLDNDLPSSTEITERVLARCGRCD